MIGILSGPYLGRFLGSGDGSPPTFHKLAISRQIYRLKVDIDVHDSLVKKSAAQLASMALVFELPLIP